MKNTVLSRKAAVAKGALLAHLRPVLATDAKIDLTPVLAKLTADNFKAEIPNIVAGVEKLAKGKMAKDAKLEGLDVLLGAIAMDETAEEEKKDDKATDAEPEGLKGFLKGKMSEDDYKAACDMMEAEDAEEDDEDMAGDDKEDDDKKDKIEAKDKGAKDKMGKDKAKDGMVTKAAMDSALKAVRDETLKHGRDLRDAEKFVQPWVGAIAVAQDSAEAVYRTALGMLNVKDADKLPAAALRPILENIPVPGATTKRMNVNVVAMDAAGAKSYAERFPNAARIGRA